MDITIEGRKVTVDDKFKTLSRAEQEATVEEIAGYMGVKPGQGGSGETTSADVGGAMVRMGAKAVTGGLGVGPAAGAVADAPTGGGGYMAGLGLIRDLITGKATPQREAPVSTAVEQIQEKAAGALAPAPTTPGGRIIEAAGTAAIEAIAGSGLFKVAGQIFTSYPEAKAAFDALAAGPKAQAAYSAAAGGGGQAAQEAGLPPIVGTVAGLAGAAGGHAAGSAARSAAGGMADDVLRRTVPIQEDAAAERLRRTATSTPDELVNKLTFGESPELVPGSKPTLYEVTGDKGIGGQERKAFTADTPLEPDTGGGKTFRTEMEARREAQNEARVGEVLDLGGQGDKTAIVDTFRRQREILDQGESFKENVAQAEADRTVGRAGTTATPEDVGAGLRGPMEESRQRVAEAGNRLYQALDAEGVTVGTGQLKAAVAQHFKDIPENPLSSLERRIAKVVSGYGGRLDFETLQQLRSRVAAEARNFQGNDVTRRRFTLLKKAIDQAMDDGLQRAVSADLSLVTKVDDALTAAQREANRHWAEYKTAYGPEPVLKKGATESGFKMTEAAIPKASFTPGDTGGARIRAMKAAGATDDALAEAAAFSMQKAAIRDGAVDPTAFRRWANAHQSALAELPLPVRQRFQSAADAANTLEQVTTAKQTALRGFDESAVGKILNTPVADLEKTIKSYLETPSRAHELANAVSRDPAAKAGLQRLTADYVLRQFTNASENLSKASLTNWLTRNKAQMSAIFGQEGTQRLERLVKDVERSRAQMTVGKDPAGPGTAGDMASMMNSASETVMSTLAHAVGGPAGSVVGGLLKGIVGNLKTAGMKDVDAIFARALLDPEFARKLLTKAPALKNERFRKGLGTAILRSSALGAAYGGS
jgi:hypothetical protein